MNPSAPATPAHGALSALQDAAIAYAEAVQLERKLTQQWHAVIKQMRTSRAALAEQQAKARAARQVLDEATEAFSRADDVRGIARAMSAGAAA